MPALNYAKLANRLDWFNPNPDQARRGAYDRPGPTPEQLAAATPEQVRNR